MLEQPNLGIAEFFYLFLCDRHRSLSDQPGSKNGNTSVAIINAAVFELLVCTTYDITNMATGIGGTHVWGATFLNFFPRNNTLQSSYSCLIPNGCAIGCLFGTGFDTKSTRR